MSTTGSGDMPDSIYQPEWMVQSMDFSKFDSSSDDDSDYKQKNPVKKILTHRVLEDGKSEYLIKKPDCSYRDCCWVSSAFLSSHPGSFKMLKNYMKENPIPPAEPLYNPEFEIPERIIAQRKNGTEFLVKWRELDYDELTWELAETLSADLIASWKRLATPPPPNWFNYEPPNPRNWYKINEVEPSKSGYTARSYQLEGLNFLVNCWFNHKNAILADEMGLGKTLQSTLFLKHLFCEMHVHGPFLVVGQLSTIKHWEREINEWSDLRVISFGGSQARRKVIKQYEMFHENRAPRFDVFVTTYQHIMAELDMLKMIRWRVLIVDEAHRLKNIDSKLLSAVKSLRVDYKLLLTGTPVQNKLQELWTLLNFLDQEKYSSWSEFEHKYLPTVQEGNLDKLQAILRPIMLRRKKNDVEKAIAPLEEVIIECAMPQHQKAYYKAVFQKNIDYLTRGAHKGSTASLRNISMELRKVCNHPYLVTDAEQQILVERKELFPEQAENQEEFVNESLIKSAGKMILLDKLLAKLKACGHRVLIFSMMLRMLDIIGDYCNYRGYKFVQLDGNVRGDDRQKIIDDFNAPDSDIFIFLLMTKAGGVGINLTSADTVIVYDGDWNPQSDIQAIARCHRIGQQKEVKAYRLLMANSYERKMFDRASLKLGLDRAVLDGAGSGDKMTAEDMDKLIRHGAYYALEENEDTTTEQFNEEDIDLIISRSQTIRHESVGGESTFSKAEFVIEEDVPVDLDDPKYWEKWVKDTKPVYVPGESIAERIMRDRDRDNSMSDLSGFEVSLKSSRHSCEELDHVEEELLDDISYWTKQRVSALAGNLWKYGYGRWEVLRTVSDLTCEISEIKAACHVILRWLLDGTSEKWQVLETVYKSATIREHMKYEAKFKRKAEFEKIVLVQVPRRLKRIDELYFLDKLIATCPNPPDEIIIPDILPCQVPWWTQKDDQTLLFWVWNNGMQQTVENITFTEPEIPSKQILTSRFKALISGLKQLYHQYTESNGQSAQFDHETLSKAINSWNKRDHRTVLHYLTCYGYPGPEKFREVSGLTSKTPAVIDEYVQTILSASDADTLSAMLTDTITPTMFHKVQSRVRMFSDIRSLDTDDLLDTHREIVELVCKTGYLKLRDSAIISDMFGSENIERKVTSLLRDIMKKNGFSFQKPSTEAPVKRPRTSSSKQSYELDSEGQPVLPLTLSSTLVLVSLGTVVHDRSEFHTERYLYTDGFTTERLAVSIENPDEKCWYICRITACHGKPVFRVELKDDPSVYFEGDTPSNPWISLLRIASKRRGSRSVTISGPEQFGLAHPLVQEFMSALPNAGLCDRYSPKPAPPAPSHPEPAPPAAQGLRPLIVNFETLLARARALREDERISEQVQSEFF